MGLLLQRYVRRQIQQGLWKRMKRLCVLKTRLVLPEAAWIIKCRIVMRFFHNKILVSSLNISSWVLLYSNVFKMICYLLCHWSKMVAKKTHLLLLMDLCRLQQAYMFNELHNIIYQKKLYQDIFVHSYMNCYVKYIYFATVFTLLLFIFSCSLQQVYMFNELPNIFKRNFINNKIFLHICT